MDKDVRAARALAQYIGRRLLKLATTIGVVVFVVVFLIIWALAAFFSAWWWLVLIPWFGLLLVALLIRTIVGFIVRQLYRSPLTGDQHRGLGALSDKIDRLIEARSTPPFVFALLTVKDLLFHRNIATIKQLMNDSASLQADYKALRSLF